MNRLDLSLQNGNKLTMLLSDTEVHTMLLQYQKSLRNDNGAKSALMLAGFLLDNFNFDGNKVEMREK